jgi:CheY-like chemotaxis protein
MQRPTQIFLIDDDEDEHMIFENMLSSISRDVDCYYAHNGFEAIRMLASTSDLPDYIFLDLSMPLMDGKECLSELKKLYDIPVIVYSASSNHADIEDSKKLGAEWFLVKPRHLQTAKLAIELILAGEGMPGPALHNIGIYRF